MATPIGHYLFGFSIARAWSREAGVRRADFVIAAVACAADLDVVPGLLVGNLGMFHHGATHSLTAATVFAGATALVYGRLQREASPKLFLVLLAVYASHLGLDAVTLDTSAPHGVPLFWPWSVETYQSPWMLLPSVQHTRDPLVSAHNVLLMVREAVIFVSLVGLTEVLTHGVRPVRWGPAAFYGAWFVVALTISVVSLR